VTRLVLHAGVGKTGTSSLQCFLAANQEQLLRHGVHYPTGSDHDEAVAGHVTSGNAAGLAVALRYSGATGPAPVARTLDRLLADCPPEASVALLSSEMLARARAHQLAMLREHAVARGHRVRAVILVRHYSDWLLSIYQQHVKVKGESRSFADYAREAPIRVADTVRHYDQAFGEDAVTVLSYDTIRHRLVEAFLEQALGLPSQGFRIPPVWVNRSLTPYEVEVLRHLNQLCRPGERHWVSQVARQLLQVAPELDDRVPFAARPPAGALDRYADDVAFLNSRLREGVVLLDASRPDEPSPEPERLLADAVRDAAAFHGLVLAQAREISAAAITMSRELDATRQDVERLNRRVERHRQLLERSLTARVRRIARKMRDLTGQPVAVPIPTARQAGPPRAVTAAPAPAALPAPAPALGTSPRAVGAA
jgi:hypothetical protein